MQENNVNNEGQVEQQTANKETDMNAVQNDIFETIFGEQADVNAAQDVQDIVEGNEPSSVETAVDPKNDQSQFQYWQSQADKRSAEVDMLKSQMTELMSKVSQPQAPVEQEAPKETISKPVKPRKPADYDHSEALTDPDSASAKYLTKQQSYLEDMSEYVSNSNEMYINQMRETEAKQQAYARDQKVMQDLQVKHGYTQEQANDFVNKMSSPDSLSLDNLVKLHKLTQNVDSQQLTQISPEAQQKKQTMLHRQEKLNIPRPIGVQPGASDQSPTKEIEDQIMDAMIGDHTKRNIF